MTQNLRSTGLNLVGDIPWGSHFCHFFQTTSDLLDTVIPYFKAGLEGRELCIWIVADPLTPAEAMQALRAAVPDLDGYRKRGTIEIHRHRDWYGRARDLDTARLLSLWQQKLTEALARGFSGLRVNGTAAWLDNGDWRSFCDYEQAIDASIAGKRMIALCTYPLAASGGEQVLDVARTHQLVVAKREGRWESVETPEFRRAKSEIGRHNRVLEEGMAQRTAELEAVNRELTRALESERTARTLAEGALERLRAIESITDSALRQLGLDELLRELLARLHRALDVDDATVFLRSEDGLMLIPRTTHGYVLDPAVRVPLGCGATGTIAVRGQPLIVDDYSTVDASGIEGMTEEALHAAVASAMGVPLRIGGKVVGVLVVASKRPRRFTPEELGLMVLVADRVAPAIELARLMETVRGGQDRQRVLARRLLTAQEEERRRLAVELHDELGQVLTAVKINLGSLERMGGAAQVPQHLRDAIGSVDQAMQRVRDLALNLRPSVLDDLGLAAGIRWAVDRFARATNVEVRVSLDPLPALPPELETTCFRVVQEALTNVARHAGAQHVWVDLKAVAEGIELLVRDDGTGFDVGAARERAIGGTSMGLIGMQERVSLAGGELEILSTPEGGTMVRARLAIPDPMEPVP